MQYIFIVSKYFYPIKLLFTSRQLTIEVMVIDFGLKIIVLTLLLSISIVTTTQSPDSAWENGFILLVLPQNLVVLREREANAHLSLAFSWKFLSDKH